MLNIACDRAQGGSLSAFRSGLYLYWRASRPTYKVMCNGSHVNDDATWSPVSILHMASWQQLDLVNVHGARRPPFRLYSNPSCYKTRMSGGYQLMGLWRLARLRLSTCHLPPATCHFSPATFQMAGWHMTHGPPPTKTPVASGWTRPVRAACAATCLSIDASTSQHRVCSCIYSTLQYYRGWPP